MFQESFSMFVYMGWIQDFIKACCLPHFQTFVVETEIHYVGQEEEQEAPTDLHYSRPFPDGRQTAIHSYDLAMGSQSTDSTHCWLLFWFQEPSLSVDSGSFTHHHNFINTQDSRAGSKLEGATLHAPSPSFCFGTSS